MNKFMLTIAALGFAGAAAAQTAVPEVSDTDGDGVYSIQELQVVFPDLDEATFALIDANGDGSVDDDELAAAHEAGTLVQQ